MSIDTRLDPHTSRRLHHLLAAAQRDGRLPSVAAGLVRGGELVWADAIGTVDGRGGAPVDSDTQYRIGSITKPFVAVVVMRLRDEGRLALTDRFGAHVPGSALDDVTIEQLLTHAAGVQAETNGPWWERTPGGDWAALAGSPVGQRFRAGRRFHYSNVGFGALGQLVATKRGRGWAQVVRAEVLEPLGMTRTTTRPTGPAAYGLAVHPFADVLLPEPEHDAGAMAPAGQLWSTVSDLARFAAFLGGDTAGVLSPDTLAEMVEPHHVVDLPGLAWTTAHGLGVQVWNEQGRRAVGHGGSMPGFIAGLRVDLESRDGVVAFTNSTTGVLGPTCGALLAALAELEPPAVTPWRAGGPVSGDAGLLELVGLWHWGPGVVQARLADGHLVLGEPGQGRGSRFRMVGPGEWVGLDGYYTGEPLHVLRRQDGSVSHLDLASFRFTRTPYDPAGDIPGGVDEAGWR